MNYLDQEGIFKVRPLDWRVRTKDGSLSVGIEIDFIVLAHLNDENQWVSWESQGDWRVRGYYNVVKKDGQPNIDTCQQLAVSLGWGGSLRAVNQPVPNIVVQVSVKAETYQGKTYHKAGWMNPEHYVPQAGGADDETVGRLEAQFGSLLRAAAKSATPKPAPKPAATRPDPKTGLVDNAGVDSIPF